MPLLNFDDMATATLASDTPPMSPPFHRRRRSWARKVERVCCQTITYFPLLFVYGLTTWSIWVAVNVSFFSGNDWKAYAKAGLALLLYILADVSYTIAVFTDPGSPLDPRTDASGRTKRGGYEGLPTYEDEEPEMPRGMSTVTAKQSGKPRYCKKCRSVKPDRSHHCSSCGKCVLKMDHHCPWLATCAGLRNYKAFLLFLIYTSLFCWVCFGVSAWWVWMEIAEQAQMEEGMRVVNTVLLAVLGGVIGIVLSGFTGWHVYLSATGQTTIESLEKTRYLSPLRKNMEHQLNAHRNYVGDENNEEHREEQTLTEHLKEIHANALPGVLRPEEGESTSPSPQPPFQHPSSSNSPASSHLRQSYASLEAQREYERYDAYLDEQDSEKLPNAFNLGWRRNLLHVFGEAPLYWFLPICNSTGDGWMWEVSPKWTNARAEIANQRLQWQSRQAQQQQQQQQQQTQQPPSFEPPATRNWKWTPGGFVDRPRPAPPRVSGHNSDGMSSEMQPLERRKASGDLNEYDTSSDEEMQKRGSRPVSGTVTENWNDVPDDFLAPKGAGKERVRSASRGRWKGD